MATNYRQIPSVDKLLSDRRIKDLIESYSREQVTTLIKHHLGGIRQIIRSGGSVPPIEAIINDLTLHAESLWSVWPKPLINATGVILHTNLGRAPLSKYAIESVASAASGYSNLELNLSNGVRGSRQTHIEEMITQLTGSEASLVVNNNASAVLLGLSAIAAGKEVIVSRGESVEIGGGFRIPDVLKQSGATLNEIGTTNRTYIRDYESAIKPETGSLLKVHTSNFLVTGFTHETTLDELVEVGTRYGIPLLYDIGCGCLLDTSEFDMTHEPTVQESVAAGVDLTFFSCDKLLGGPQAGVILGKKELISRLADHPLARAVRIDKLNLTALASTLIHYVKGEALTQIPIWRMISAPIEELKARVFRWHQSLTASSEIIQGYSTIGGGSLPGQTMPTWLLAISGNRNKYSAAEIAKRLRRSDYPVIARIESDLVLLDPRTVLPEEEVVFLETLRVATSE